MSKQNPIFIPKIRSLANNTSFSDLILSSNQKDSADRINIALAACVSACKDVLGLDPFDEQLTAAHALYSGKIIQMATGEGKTISAVFAAFLLHLAGHSVHIFTFNDYLAKRDYNWMKPIYDKLGLSVGFIVSDTKFEERKKAYGCNIVYSTAKECGFDYLKGFIAYSENEILCEKQDAVIVDEADSIMIDEARIPLVIAGSFKTEQKKLLPEAMRFVKTLDIGDYKIYEENRSVYLTDTGIEKAENFYKSDDLFSEKNADLMSLIYNCLKAEFYLKEDKNYIIRDNEILIVDEFTGRAVIGRHYPDVLQSAVEIKHNLKITSRGTVMGRVPIQYFIRQYGFIAGMTGTALSSAEEFELLYGLMTEIIPAHVPSNRTDLPTEIYYNKEVKWNAIVKKILKIHKKGQPVLIGTSNIEESVTLAEKLSAHEITAQVLNAKNDLMEAEIIKNAGCFGSVTISTNMAGRGVDILLGGADGKTRGEVISTGGLCVINTEIRESSRINDQLKGRAGRQGDIGESRTFAALDDDIMKKYELKKLIPKRIYPEYTEEKIIDKTVLREAERIQRISEGDMLDCRKDLLKYTAITEKHRNAIFGTRAKYISREAKPNIWSEYDIENYSKAVDLYGKETISNLERNLLLTVINEAWSAYLEFTDELRSGIHLTSVGGKSPIEEYNISSEKYYREMENQVIEAMLAHLAQITEMENIDDYEAEKPLEIWTYLSDERVEDLVKKPFLANVFNENSEEDEDNKHDSNTPESQKKPSFFSRLFNKK